MLHERQKYSSDLTDAQWAWLEPRLTRRLAHNRMGRPMKLELREVVNTILYVVRNGVIWADVPRDLLNPNSVYYHFRKWCLDGTWRYLNRGLRRWERVQQNRAPEPSAAIIDSQSVKTTEAGGTSGYDAGKKGKGRKRHLVVDTCGNLRDVVVHAANLQDYHGAKRVLKKVTETVGTYNAFGPTGSTKKAASLTGYRRPCRLRLTL